MSEVWDVLVVDDEPVVCDAIRRVLEAEGVRVATVADAEAALAHPGLAACRLVLCDLMLPGRSGFEAVRAIRRRRPELHILAITGYPTRENNAQALAAGATGFLAKPFDDEELLNLTRHGLAQADAAGEEGRT